MRLQGAQRHVFSTVMVVDTTPSVTCVCLRQKMNNMFVLVPFYISASSNWVALFLLTFLISRRIICS